MITNQTRCWSSKVGRDYTDRCNITYKQHDLDNKKWFGISRTEINRLFFKNFNRSMRILEVGTNTGLELIGLQKLGFKNLYGIELQQYAVNIANKQTMNLNIIQGNAFDIPFKDNYFDMVFTHGVLIHIAEKNILEAMQEIYRCTSKYIFGFEYYADKYTEINWRGRRNQMFRANHAELYQSFFPNLKLVKEVKYHYKKRPDIDSAFLLKKI